MVECSADKAKVMGSMVKEQTSKRAKEQKSKRAKEQKSKRAKEQKSWVIGRWKSLKQAREIHGRCIDSFRKFLRIWLDETIGNTYFLAPFYCFGQLTHCFEISGKKNNFEEQLEAEIAKKIRNSPASAESYWFFFKK